MTFAWQLCETETLNALRNVCSLTCYCENQEGTEVVGDRHCSSYPLKCWKLFKKTKALMRLKQMSEKSHFRRFCSGRLLLENERKRKNKRCVQFDKQPKNKHFILITLLLHYSDNQWNSWVLLARWISFFVYGFVDKKTNHLYENKLII